MRWLISGALCLSLLVRAQPNLPCVLATIDETPLDDPSIVEIRRWLRYSYIPLNPTDKNCSYHAEDIDACARFSIIVRARVWKDLWYGTQHEGTQTPVLQMYNLGVFHYDGGIYADELCTEDEYKILRQEFLNGVLP